MISDNKKTIIIGYSGHSYVCIEALLSQGLNIVGYCDSTEKNKNLFSLKYLGNERKLPTNIFEESIFFIGIGENTVRKNVFNFLKDKKAEVINAINIKSNISSTVKMGIGNLIVAGATINSFTIIGNGVICNTQSSIDHECSLGDFSHIGPGTVLCGNVSVGECTFVGANAVVKQGITIGNNCLIGAGTVIIKDVPDNTTIVGNPGKIINK